jgi:hypothetical protein
VKRLVDFTKEMALWVLHMGIFWAKAILKNSNQD